MGSPARKAKIHAQQKRRPRRSKRAEVERILARVGTIERIAGGFDENDRNRLELLQISREFLGDLGPVPVSVAASLLGVSEPTVRAWARRGLLVYSDGPGSGLDAGRLHEVITLARDLRAAGHHRDLLNKVWHRLMDDAVLRNDDLRVSLEQMRRGEGIPTDADELARELGLDE
ncbi:hypothetical protein Ade02nite_74200 [Paractinoplanes deccanensis]|uniref:Uncharacterized protein n=1 Tax=Paractinoplanes deccanensis TaxID=113561 RepID=A0ABQ3YFJ6_9ACTN|nr:hypothetical protein [Actinoplanes deccanensis]GID78779.1 hypothetical protein Ade02nite_74200 [Actinoplanes deccanensis]